MLEEKKQKTLSFFSLWAHVELIEGMVDQRI